MHSFVMSIARKALVLKKFSLSGSGPEYVHIVARKSGLISWFLTLLGIDTTTTLRVFADRIAFERGSLNGKLYSTMPLRAVSVVECGYMKPFILLAAAIIIAIAGVIFAFAVTNSEDGLIILLMITAVLAGSFLLSYILNKSLLISIESHSGTRFEICFKRSVIEGVGVDFEQAQEAIRLIDELTLAQASK